LSIFHATHLLAFANCSTGIRERLFVHYFLPQLVYPTVFVVVEDNRLKSVCNNAIIAPRILSLQQTHQQVAESDMITEIREKKSGKGQPKSAQHTLCV
jgi:hypothetical protein